MAIQDVRPTKLFIGGISQNTTTKDMRAHFSQYGRVLDCVAMRKEDGRARSFGYVTLDSPMAADKCIAEPQYIDGRVVDVKRAVPERSSRDSQSQFDKANDKRTVVRPSKKEGLDLTFARDFTFDLEGLTESPMELCADAPEFVPWDVSIVAGVTQDDLESDGSSEDPSGTTFMDTMKAKLLSLGAPPGLRAPPGLSCPLTGLPASFPPPPSAPPPPPPAGVAAVLKKKYDEAGSCTATPSTTPGTVIVDCEDDSQSDEDLQLGVVAALPSLGASLHASGECRPCNFFGKGRCASGTSCEFCHMPHQKKKPTRQEKRDRKASWLARQASEKGQATLLSPLVKVELTEENLKKAAAAASNEVPASPLQPLACLINFDDYSDFSDDDDEVQMSSPALQQASFEEKALACWSRETLLSVRAAMSTPH